VVNTPMRSLTHPLILSRILIALSFVGTVTSAESAEGTRTFGPFIVDAREPTAIRLSGTIGVNDALNFRRALQHASNAKILVLQSPGGSVQAALMIADDVYERKIATLVPRESQCMSACSLIFFAGFERHVHGQLGVHQLTSSSVAGTQLAVSDIIDLLARFEVPAEALAIMFRTPSDSMHVFTGQEIERLNVNRSIVVPEGTFGNYPLASCAGWNGTITEMAGQDGRNASLKGLVTKADVIEYCERDPGGSTIKYGGRKTISECVDEHSYVLNTQLRTVADCSRGVLRFSSGSRPERVLRMPPPQDSSCASGVPPLLHQFQTLCPLAAKRYGVK
jgi:hypothetical protein